MERTVARRENLIMSSTNRTAGIRHANDFYETPRWCTDLALDQLPQTIDGPIVDCGAGSGAITRALIDRYGRPERIYAVEIDERHWPELEALSVNVVRGDYLNVPLPDAALVVGNPPFEMAQQFVDRSLESTRAEKGIVALLLRLSFVAGRSRRKFHLDNPSDVYVLSKRPSFVAGLKWKACGAERCPHWVAKNATAKRVRCDLPEHHGGPCRKLGTDSCDYAWFRFGSGADRRVTVL